MVIVLMGYMGSGKSVVGEKLAKTLGYKFYDLDVYISAKLQTTIPDIFKTKGEIYFRKQETIALKDIIQSKTKIVLSLGGGTPCYAQNLGLIKNTPSVISFYLETSIPELVTRLFEQRKHRPIIAHLDTHNALTEFIGKHLFERRYYYMQSDYTINTNAKTVNGVVEAITLKLIEIG